MQTNEEVLANKIGAMGEELGRLYHVILDEVTWLHWKWGQLKILFSEKPSRIDLMNQSAPFFFQVVHDSLFESTLLGIARIVGSPVTYKKENLTIQRLDGLIADTTLKTEVRKLIDEAETTAQFATDWRNRHIAHRDLRLALKESVNLLPTATIKNVDDALAAIQRVLDRIEGVYCNSSMVYARSPWGAQTLLHYVQGGLLRERDKREKWSRGERHDDDINPPARESLRHLRLIESVPLFLNRQRLHSYCGINV